MRNFPRQFLLLSLCCLAPLGRTADLLAYTEEWAPYSFMQDKQVVGIASDLLRSACAQARLHCEISIVPWARAYETARQQPNTLVFATARLPEREKQFLWLGPIQPRALWLFGRNEARLPLALHAAELPRYRIGVVNGDAAIANLRQLGIAEASLDKTVSTAVNLRKLLAGRVDLVNDTEVAMAWNLRKLGKAPDSVRKVMLLQDGGDYYYALNPASDPARVARLSAALQTVRASKEMAQIIERYTGSGKP